MKTKTGRPELEALARQDYQLAIPLLQKRAAERPADLEAQLELGLAHMLAGDEAQFAAIHQRVAATLPPRARRGRIGQLWTLSLGYFERLVQAASLVAALGATACVEKPAPVPNGEPVIVTPPDEPRTRPKYVAEQPDRLPPGAYSEYAVQRPRPIDTLQPVPIVKPEAPPDAGRPTVRPDTEQRNKYGVVRPRYMVRPAVTPTPAPRSQPRRRPRGR